MRISDWSSTCALPIALADSGLHYEPGDALGIWPRNPAPLVEAVLDTLKLDGDSPVELAAQALPLRAWLADKRELTRLARPFIAAHAALSGSAELQAVLAQAKIGRASCRERVCQYV